MKCGFCFSRNVKFVCSHCLTTLYCNRNCQENDFEKHSSFCLIQGKKRTIEEMTEEERQVAKNFLDVLEMYKHDPTQDLKGKLEELYGQMTEKQQEDYFEDLPCHNIGDPVQIERPPTTAGLPGLLFVDELSKQDSHWAQKARNSLYNTTLYLKGDKIPFYDKIQKEPGLSNEERVLLAQILEKEETIDNNGWNQSPSTYHDDVENSIDAFIVCLKRKFISAKVLNFLSNHWYPVVCNGPGRFVYGETTIYTFFDLKADIDDYTKDIPSEKIRNFVADMIIFNLEQTLSHFKDFYWIYFDDLIHAPIYPFTNRIWTPFFESIASACNTYQEYFWGVFIHEKSEKLSSYVQKHKNQYDNIARILIELIRKHFDYSVRHTVYHSLAGNYVLMELTKDYKDLHILVNAMEDLITQKDQNPVVYSLPQQQSFEKGAAPVVFLLSNFLLHSFQIDWIRDNPPKFTRQLRDQVQSNPPVHLETQMIEIVINEGTTKDVFNAQLTELIQNSLDAISLYNPLDKTLNVQLGQTDNHQLFISVTDYVGIDVNGIIALSIPFYSEKKDVKNLVGEMGTGFFNVYRSKEVFIETLSNGHAFFIHDTTVKDQNTQRVVDVNRKLYYKSNSDKNKTTITIISESMDQNQLLLVLSSARYFVKNVLALIQPKIQLDNMTVNKKLSLSVSNNMFELFYPSSIVFKDTFPSYVLTKGMPFLPLKRFLAQEIDNSQRSQEVDNLVETIFGKKNTELFNRMSSDKYPMAELLTHELLENNTVLNFLQGTYTPVQTRSKITLDPKIRVNLWRFMLDALYEKILGEKDFLEVYFQFYSSKDVPVDQVMFGDKESSMSVSNFASAYEHTEVNISFISLLTEIYNNYKKLVESNSEKYPAEFSASRLKKLQATLLKQRKITPLFQKVLDIVYGWLNTKTVRTKEEIEEQKKERRIYIQQQKKKEEQSLVKTDNRYDTIVKWLEIWVQSYIASGKVQNIFAIDKENPTIEVTPFGASSFSIVHNKIHFSITESNYDKHTEIIDIFKQDTFYLVSTRLDNAQENALFKDFYGPFGTIAHELEHYRRNESHAGNAHGNAVINLPEGGHKERNFQKCHADTMKSILQIKFYEQVWEKVKKEYK